MRMKRLHHNEIEKKVVIYVCQFSVIALRRWISRKKTLAEFVGKNRVAGSCLRLFYNV